MKVSTTPMSSMQAKRAELSKTKPNQSESAGYLQRRAEFGAYESGKLSLFSKNKPVEEEGVLTFIPSPEMLYRINKNATCLTGHR